MCDYQVLIICFLSYSTIYTQSFSVRSNWNRLFTVSSTQKYSRLNPDLRFINGIRVLTMFWIVFAHVCILGTLFAPMLVCKICFILFVVVEIIFLSLCYRSVRRGSSSLWPFTNHAVHLQWICIS